jgi:uncharacterized protein YkwD
MTPNWIDLLLLALIVLGAFGGWRRGFILEFVDLAAWMLAVWLALRYYHAAAQWLAPQARWAAAWNRPIAFLGLFLLAHLLLRVVAGAATARLPARLHLHPASRALGMAPGLAHGLINAVIMAALLMALPLPFFLQQQARDSALGNRFATYAEAAEAALRPVLDDAIGETMNLLTVKPQSNEVVALPFTVQATRPRPDLEAQMLVLVNRERQAAGLAPLAADPELVPVARLHSADMLARGYFSHYTPEGRDPFQRMHAGRVSFLVAGENLAFAPTLSIAHTGLMRSPGHRANILRPQFGRVGIGIVDAGIRGIMVTQEFRN